MKMKTGFVFSPNVLYQSYRCVGRSCYFNTFMYVVTHRILMCIYSTLKDINIGLLYNP